MQITVTDDNEISRHSPLAIGKLCGTKVAFLWRVRSWQWRITVQLWPHLFHQCHQQWSWHNTLHCCSSQICSKFGAWSIYQNCFTVKPVLVSLHRWIKWNYISVVTVVNVNKHTALDHIVKVVHESRILTNIPVIVQQIIFVIIYNFPCQFICCYFSNFAVSLVKPLKPRCMTASPDSRNWCNWTTCFQWNPFRFRQMDHDLIVVIHV